jgi:hypothetical protein
LLALGWVVALGCADTGYLDAISQNAPIGAHLERQERALWLLHWVPWMLFFGGSALAVALGWQWQRWSARRVRRSIWMLGGLAIALPPLFMLGPLYLLFFELANPAAMEIADAISEALNGAAFAVVLDLAGLGLFLIVRTIRR